jgi:hypothetical protein
MSKGAIETAVMQLFFATYAHFSEVYLEYRIQDESKKETTDLEKKKIRCAYEEYYNILDYMCAKYLNNEISGQTFCQIMSKEIKKRCADEKTLAEAAEHGAGKGDIEDKWPNIRKVYTRLTQKEKWLNKLLRPKKWLGQRKDKSVVDSERQGDV